MTKQQSIIHSTQQQLLLFVFIVTHNDVYAAFVYCSVQNDPANTLWQIFFKKPFLKSSFNVLLIRPM